MENYILNLLKENGRVILPEFGAFIIRQKDPPEIAFNGLLTFNDGILTEYISDKAGITFLEAAAKVNDYIEKLKSQLKTNNRLIFNEIGWIWTDDSGDKQFTPWHPTGNIQTEKQTGKKDIGSILTEAERIVTDTSVIVPDQVGESAPFILDDTMMNVEADAHSDNQTRKFSDLSYTKEDLSHESFSLDNEEKSPPVHQFSDVETELKSEMPLEKTEPEPIISVVEPSVVSEITHDPQEIPMDTSNIDEPLHGKSVTSEPATSKKSLEEFWQGTEEQASPRPVKIEQKKNRSWLTTLMVIIVLGSLGCTAWFVFPDQIRSILHLNPRADEEMVQKEALPDQSIINSPVEESNEAPEIQESIQDPGTEETTLPSEPVIPGNVKPEAKKFYIVAGMFSSKKNAEILAAKLRDQGFNAEVFGTHNNLHAVSFSSFNTRTEAERERDHIRQTTEPKAWILEY